MYNHGLEVWSSRSLHSHACQHQGFLKPHGARGGSVGQSQHEGKRGGLREDRLRFGGGFGGGGIKKVFQEAEQEFKVELL